MNNLSNRSPDKQNSAPPLFPFCLLYKVKRLRDKYKQFIPFRNPFQKIIFFFGRKERCGKSLPGICLGFWGGGWSRTLL